MRGVLGLLVVASVAGVAGCVAPEVPEQPVGPRIAAPRAANLEPAPLANRALRPPGSPSLVNVDAGILGAKKPKAEGDSSPAK